MSTITVVMPAEMIAERQRLGLDTRDEVWEGVYHVVPPASEEHQRIAGRIYVALFPAVEATGLEYRYEVGLFDPAGPNERDYCVPDLVVFDNRYRTAAGVNRRAELVIEIRSPGDDSLLKVPYYSRVGVQELLIIERDTKAMRRWVTVAGGLEEAAAGPEGWHFLAALPLRLRDGGGRLEVDLGTELIVI
jgi:Uma2 family endonuclease